MRESHPLTLLQFASSLLAVTDPREADPLAQARGEPPTGPDRDELITSFLEVRRAETTALLTAIAELLDDEPSAQRIRRELAGRPHKPPRWLRRLTPIRVGRAVEMTHILGDGDNVMLDVTTGTDHALTVLVYIDHNMGTLVKDAFVVDAPLSSLQGQFEQMTGDEPDTHFVDLDLADARARITEAIALGAITYPPFETDTWPGCRPLVEWVVRHLPEGGSGYVRPEWSDEDRDALIERFLDSKHLPPGDVEAAEDLAAVFVWFACDYGPGDPLRWSPVSCEILLTDFLAHKAILPDATMQRGPDVLRAFVRFAHAEQGLRPALTAQTLEAIDEYAPDYLDAIADRDDASGLRGRNAWIMEQLLEHGLPEEGLGFTFDEDGTPVPLPVMTRRLLAEEVGSEETLDALTTTPLPDEPLDLSAVPEDVRDRAAAIAALTDRCCEELLDVEHRTACRRLLADVAAGDPRILRRRSKDETAAAAIAWVIAKANGTLDPYHGGLTARDLIGWFGVSGSVSQRAEPMLRAVGLPPRALPGMRLGTPRYLVSTARARIIERRDRAR